MKTTEAPFYSGNIKKRIAILFMLLGGIMAFDSLIVLILPALWKDNPVVDIFHYYVVGIAMTIIWSALSFLLTGKDRIAGIIKVVHCVLVLLAGMENVGMHWLMLLLFNVTVYILLISSKSLTPFMIPGIMLLSTSIFYFIAPLVGMATGIDLKMVGYIIYAINTGAGVLIILNFKKWLNDKERTI